MTQYDEWKPADHVPGPAIDEPVLAVLADGTAAMMSLAIDDDLHVVWSMCYLSPVYHDGGWHCNDAEYDDEYDVRLWCRLPTPPAIEVPS